MVVRKLRLEPEDVNIIMGVNIVRVQHILFQQPTHICFTKSQRKIPLY